MGRLTAIVLGSAAGGCFPLPGMQFGMDGRYTCALPHPGQSFRHRRRRKLGVGQRVSYAPTTGNAEVLKKTAQETQGNKLADYVLPVTD
jgi:hypothetical protein